MTLRLLCSIATLAYAPLACAQGDTPRVVPVEATSYHVPVFSNDYVTVLNVFIPSQRDSGYHRHSLDSVAVGESSRMRVILDLVKVVARSDSSVIITGESGTGKEVIANMLHHLGRRRHQPFVAVSCALFSDTLIETELFGHERGAFTGAIKDKPGRFELATGGTLFLDDIDDVPLGMQVKLLRALQNREVERVGGTKTIPVNVRIITGTKRDLKKMVAEGKFREDLFYRLNVLPIVLPRSFTARSTITSTTAGAWITSACRRPT